MIGCDNLIILLQFCKKYDLKPEELCHLSQTALSLHQATFYKKMSEVLSTWDEYMTTKAKDTRCKEKKDGKDTEEERHEAAMFLHSKILALRKESYPSTVYVQNPTPILKESTGMPAYYRDEGLGSF